MGWMIQPLGLLKKASGRIQEPSICHPDTGTINSIGMGQSSWHKQKLPSITRTICSKSTTGLRNTMSQHGSCHRLKTQPSSETQVHNVCFHQFLATGKRMFEECFEEKNVYQWCSPPYKHEVIPLKCLCDCQHVQLCIPPKIVLDVDMQPLSHINSFQRFQYSNILRITPQIIHEDSLEI